MIEGTAIREVKDGDVNLIYSTWLRSFLYNSPITESIRSDIYFPNHQKVLDRILVSPETKIKVLVLKEDDRVIVGYIVYQDPQVHFIYVKPAFRKEGVASELLEDMGLPRDLKDVQYSHMTWDSIKLKIAGKWKAIYNPYFKEK